MVAVRVYVRCGAVPCRACRLVTVASAAPTVTGLRRNLDDTGLHGTIPAAWCKAPIAQNLALL